MLFKSAVFCTSDQCRGNRRPGKMTSSKTGSFLYHKLLSDTGCSKKKKLPSRRTSLTDFIRRISLKEEENQGANNKQEPTTSSSTQGWGKGGLRALCEPGPTAGALPSAFLLQPVQHLLADGSHRYPTGDPAASRGPFPALPKGLLWLA